MVTSVLFQSLEKNPSLFQETLHHWKITDKLQSVNNPSVEAVKSLILSLLDKIDFSCSLDNDPDNPGLIIYDRQLKPVYHLRIVRCPGSRPIGLRYLQTLVGAMEPGRIHNVIFVLIFKCSEDVTSHYTKHAASYMRKCRHYEFLDATELVKKVYQFT